MRSQYLPKLPKDWPEAAKYVQKLIWSANADNCPFLYSWFKGKLEQICKKPDHVERQGIPKRKQGEPYRMVRKKEILALLTVIHPLPNLKKFAQAFDMPYGTVRNWRTSRVFLDKANSLKHEFTDAFMKELEKIAALPKGKLSLSEFVKKQTEMETQLFGETKEYKNIGIIEILINKMESKVSKGNGDISWFVTFINFLVIYSDLTKDSPEMTEQFLQNYFKLQKRITGAFFDETCNLIKKGKTEEAVEYAVFAKTIMEGMIDDRYRLITDLKMGRGKKNARRATPKKNKPKK